MNCLYVGRQRKIYSRWGKVLPRSGTIGVAIWGGDLGVVGFNVEKPEGVYLGFPLQVTGKKEIMKNYRSWWKAAAESVLQGTGTQPPQTYIDSRQATVKEWMDLWPIFEVCTKEMGYKGGGKFQEPWWRQEAAEQQLVAT